MYDVAHMFLRNPSLLKKKPATLAVKAAALRELPGMRPGQAAAAIAALPSLLNLDPGKLRDRWQRLQQVRLDGCLVCGGGGAERSSSCSPTRQNQYGHQCAKAHLALLLYFGQFDLISAGDTHPLPGNQLKPARQCRCSLSPVCWLPVRECLASVLVAMSAISVGVVPVPLQGAHTHPSWRIALDDMPPSSLACLLIRGEGRYNRMQTIVVLGLQDKVSLSTLFNLPDRDFEAKLAKLTKPQPVPAAET